jgi:hypothetical protein
MACDCEPLGRNLGVIRSTPSERIPAALFSGLVLLLKKGRNVKISIAGVLTRSPGDLVGQAIGGSNGVTITGGSVFIDDTTFEY